MAALAEISRAREEIRRGRFVTEHGFLPMLAIRANWTTVAVEDPPDPNMEMPIIAWSWRGSGYEPMFESLN